MLRITSALAPSLVVASALAAWPAHAGPCNKEGQTAQTIKSVSVGELAQLLDATTTARDRLVVVDVNSPTTRQKHGVIPGAILLSSASQYAAEKELPAGKSTPLVFYCANLKCGASKTAAERALQAGYVNVAILPEGIAGWREAQQPTQTPAI